MAIAWPNGPSVLRGRPNPNDHSERPTVRHPEARPATPISEYARKAAPQGRSSPGHNLIEEDVLDIPAFLRRKAI